MISKRSQNVEAIEALKKIPILQNMLPKTEEIDEAAHKRQVMVENAGFLFLSRFTKEESENPKVREKAQKTVDVEEDSVSLEAKSHEISHGSGVLNAEKSRRYALSLATLAAKPHKREFIVDKGAIPVLVELSALHDRLVQVRCASAFASLSSEPSIRPRMLEEGALPMINMLAQNTNIREIKFDCCRALCNLCCVVGQEPKLVKEGMTVTLMNIALTCPETYDICLHALVNLSSVSEKYNRIEDVSEALLFFYNLGGLSVNQETLLLQGFCNLSALRSNQLRLVEEGALKVVEKYYRSPQEHLRRMACEMLKNFTTDVKSRLKLLEINIIDIILEMSREPDLDIQCTVAKCFLFLAKDASFRRKIVFSDAFVLILQTSKNQSSVQLEEEKRHIQEEIGQVSAKTLRILCDDHELASKLISDGISHAIVGLMTRSSVNNEESGATSNTSGAIKQFCIEALCSLFTHKASLLLLLQEHSYVVDHIVTLAKTTNDRRTIEWCAYAVYQITQAKVVTYATLEEKILPCLLQLCDDRISSTDLTRLFCAGSLAHCTLINGLDCCNCIPMFITLLYDNNNDSNENDRGKGVSAPQRSVIFGDEVSIEQEYANNIKEAERMMTLVGIKRYAATSLFNLAKSEDACRIMLEANVLTPLVKLTLSSETKAISAGILSRLSLYPANYEYFASPTSSADKDALSGKTSVLQVLLELSTVDDRLTQRRVVVALSNLSQHDELRTKLLSVNLQPGPIAYIVTLASSEKADEYLRRGCISILVNLSYPLGNEADILTKGVISTLMITSMITTNQIESRIICIKAIVNLMADRSLYAKMVDEGLIWCLSKLPFLTSNTADGGKAEVNESPTEVKQQQLLLELCAKALCRLSVTAEFARKMIASSLCVGTILALLRSDTMSLKIVGARTLTNLLLETKNESEMDEMFRKRCVDNMSPMLVIPTEQQSSSELNQEIVEELNELSVVCLCMVSQSEACRTTIVNRQMMVNTHTGITNNNRNTTPSSKNNNASVAAKDRAISLAYITMITNIANNEEMRTKILDEHLLAKFRRILLSNDPNDETLKLAVTKALYCISCDEGNIRQLVNQNVLQFIQDCFLTVHDREEEYDAFEDSKSGDEHEKPPLSSSSSIQQQSTSSLPVLSSSLLLHLIAALFNLTTNTTVQQTLVSSGIVRLFASLWPQIIKENGKEREEASKLTMLAICHLACGRTNSSQMVREGCTPILNFITNHRNSPATANFAFYFQEQLRVSAAFRNLLSVVGNQQQMVDEGCLQVLIALANASNRMTTSKSIGSVSSSISAALAAQANNNTKNNHSANSIPTAGTYEGVKAIRLNCATALKCMTFNVDLRPLLMSSEAIQIIMAEIKKESDLTMNDELLKELEAESWENGGRGKLKEGRAKGAMALEPSPIYTKLLLKNTTNSNNNKSSMNVTTANNSSASNVSLNISKKDVILEKYSVQVQADDDQSHGERVLRRDIRQTITRMSAGALPAADIAAIAAAVNSTTSALIDNSPLMSATSTTNEAGISPKISPKKLKLQRMSTAARLAAAPADLLIPQEVKSMFEEDANNLLSIKRLTTRDESDESMALVPQRYTKQECAVDTDPKTLIDLTDDNMSTSTMDDQNHHSSSNLLITPSANSNRSFAFPDNSNDSKNGGMVSPIGSASSQSPSPIASSRRLHANAVGRLSGIKDGGSSPRNSNSNEDGKESVGIKNRGSIVSASVDKPRSKNNRLSPLRRSASSADKLKQTRRQQQEPVTASVDEEQMMHLVAMIKKAKELQERDERTAIANSAHHGGRVHRVGEDVQESRIGEVLEKWKQISRF